MIDVRRRPSFFRHAIEFLRRMPSIMDDRIKIAFASAPSREARRMSSRRDSRMLSSVSSTDVCRE
jgi:hypothetical protein